MGGGWDGLSLTKKKVSRLAQVAFRNVLEDASLAHVLPSPALKERVREVEHTAMLSLPGGATPSEKALRLATDPRSACVASAKLSRPWHAGRCDAVANPQWRK